MRGKEGEDYESHADDRITPAYAGKSGVIQSALNLYEDHPRLCGEKLSLLKNEISAMGSPPPMRGKVSNIPTPELPLGITPAYAGKSAAVTDTR